MGYYTPTKNEVVCSDESTHITVIYIYIFINLLLVFQVGVMVTSGCRDVCLFEYDEPTVIYKSVEIYNLGTGQWQRNTTGKVKKTLSPFRLIFLHNLNLDVNLIELGIPGPSVQQVVEGQNHSIWLQLIISCISYFFLSLFLTRLAWGLTLE